MDLKDNCINISCPIIAVAKEFPPNHLIALHQHSRSQFLYASSGLTEKMMRNWHIQFEKAAPDEHLAFLVFLQISGEEIEAIKKSSTWHNTNDRGM